jgi:hypothetical protein
MANGIQNFKPGTIFQYREFLYVFFSLLDAKIYYLDDTIDEEDVGQSVSGMFLDGRKTPLRILVLDKKTGIGGPSKEQIYYIQLLCEEKIYWMNIQERFSETFEKVTP